MNRQNQLDSDKKNVVDVAEEGEVVAESRRKFIKTAGKLGLYTPPALMVLMNPSAEAFAKSADGRDVRARIRRRKRRRRRRLGDG